MPIASQPVPAPSHPLADVDRLGDEIAELSAHLDAATARLLTLIREFDARGGWNSGFSSCAAWLGWRVGLDLGAARERVRVARALGSLPRLAEALACGELFYAKLRALTRVATPATEARLLAVGRAGTAAQIERIVRDWRRVDRQAEVRQATRQHAERGTVLVRGRLTPEVGALLIRALDAARETLYQRTRATAGVTAPDPAMAPPTRAQQQAAALADPEQPGQSVLEEGGHVSAETSRRLACDASRVVMRHYDERRFCHARVGEGHHVRHWAQGGPTTLGNLVLLCRRHHHAVHEDGYRAFRGPDGTLDFRRPDGRPLPEVPPTDPVPADPPPMC
jgi:HNH endonuclease